MVYLWYLLTQVSLKKRPLNGVAVAVASFLENQEMSGNFALVREMSWK